jgi:hypothetical protein
VTKEEIASREPCHVMHGRGWTWYAEIPHLAGSDHGMRRHSLPLRVFHRLGHEPGRGQRCWPTREAAMEAMARAVAEESGR